MFSKALVCSTLAALAAGSLAQVSLPRQDRRRSWSVSMS